MEKIIKNPIKFLSEEVKSNKISYTTIEDVIIHIFFVYSSGFKFKEINGITEIVKNYNENDEKKMFIDSEKFLQELKDKLIKQEDELEKLIEVSLNKIKVENLIKDKVIPSKEVLSYLIETLKKSNMKIKKILEIKNSNKNFVFNNIEDYKNIVFNEEILEYSLIHSLNKNIICDGCLINNIPKNLNQEFKDILDITITKLLNSKSKRKDMLEIQKSVKYLKKFSNFNFKTKGD